MSTCDPSFHGDSQQLNYSVENWEVLAVLEEWTHWLEGADQTSLVWTDDTNLEYLCSSLLHAIRLHLVYRLRSQNGASAVFRLKIKLWDVATILPLDCAVVVSPGNLIRWTSTCAQRSRSLMIGPLDDSSFQVHSVPGSCSADMVPTQADILE